VVLTCPVSRQESPQSPPWGPPFYLAPPYYPHPAYHYNPSLLQSYDTFQPPTQAPATVKPQAWLVRPGSLEPKPLDKYQVFYPISPTTSSSSYPGSHVASPSLHQRPDILTSRPSDNQDAAPPRSFLAVSPGHVGEAGLQPPSTADHYYHYYHLPKINLPLPTPPPHPHPGPKTVNEQRPPDSDDADYDDDDRDDGGGVEWSDPDADKPHLPHTFPAPRSQNASLRYFEFLQKMVEAASASLQDVSLDQYPSRSDAIHNPNHPTQSPEPPSHQYQNQLDQAPVATTTSSPAHSLTGTTMRTPLPITHYPFPYANFYANPFLQWKVPDNPSWQEEEVGSRQEARHGLEKESKTCQQGVKSESPQPEDVMPFFDYPYFQPTIKTKRHMPSPRTRTTPPPPTIAMATTTTSTTTTPTATPSPDILRNPLQNVYYHAFYPFYYNLYDSQKPSDPSAPHEARPGSPEESPEAPSQTSASPTKQETPVGPDPLYHYPDAKDHAIDGTQPIPPTENQQAASMTIESNSDADDFAPYHYHQYYHPIELQVDAAKFFDTDEDGYLRMDQDQSMSYHSPSESAAQQDLYGPFQLLNMEAQGWQGKKMTD